jgi:hypothetical protein
MEYKDMVDPNDSLPNEEKEEIKVIVTMDEFEFIREMLISQYEAKVADTKFCSMGYKAILRDCLKSFNCTNEMYEIDADYNFYNFTINKDK